MQTPPAPVVKRVKKRAGSNFPAGKMLIPTPKLIEEVVRQIRKGKIRTTDEIRDELAVRYGADFTCPLTTGIFLRIVAENAEFERAQGKKRIAPYWRVVDRDGSLKHKFPGGTSAQARHLKSEGIKVIKRGKKFLVPLVK